MGVSLLDLRTILRIRNDGLLPDRFAIAEIGAQQFSSEVLHDPDIMAAYAAAFGVAPLGAEALSADGSRAEAGNAPYSKAFWDWLGCPYMAVDYDGSSHCIQLDLNFDDAPAAHHGRYQLVTNLGTTEHVANQLQAMKVIHELTAHRGIMIHTVPAQGNADHAMFNYNPKFFWALSRSCRYHIHQMRLVALEDDVPLRYNVLDFLIDHDRANAEWLRRYRVTDCYLHVVMEKRENIPYVPPIEVHAGVASDSRLKARYWTVFE